MALTEMPPRWLVGLAALGCSAISLFVGSWRLAFKPTDGAALMEVSAPVVAWERKPVGGDARSDYDLILELEEQTRKFSFPPFVRPFGDGLETVEAEVTPGTQVTVKVAKEGFPLAPAFALSSAEKSYLTLEQTQEAEVANVGFAIQMALAFGAGAVFLFVLYRYYDRFNGGMAYPPAAGKDEDGAAAVAAAVARLSEGKGGRDAEDLETLRAGWLLVPSLEPVTEGQPFPMPSTTNGAGEKIAYLFSHRAAFDAWGSAPHFVELQGRDAFKLVLAGGFFGAAIDVSGPRMLGLTRGVLEDLADDDA